MDGLRHQRHGCALWREGDRAVGPHAPSRPSLPRLLTLLDFVAKGELYALFHLVSLRGLRRGEACGLRWEDVDLKSKTVTIATQLVEENGGVIGESAPKSDAGNRVVALDVGTIAVLRKHRARQGKAQLAAGEAWVDSGRVFTRATGEWLPPDWLSDHFDRLVRSSGLPPIRLHDLRHGAQPSPSRRAPK
ncbi:site-specific integrase [Actinoplanes sp. NPDC049802]|uniref:site-specific integrase n=1 Tax=Actinoplanes sp. NPDC049802 TaxID=3154742 RepID=UPI003404F11B